MRRSYKLALLAACSTAMATPAFAATAVSGSMNLHANASIGGGALAATDNDSRSYVGAPVAMAIFALASINDGVTGGNVTAKGQAQSSGTANAGTVHFQDYGWSFSAPDPADAGQDANLNDHSGGDDWSYTFIADHSGTFEMSYDTFISFDGGLVFGLWGWDIEWSGAGGGQSLINVNDPTTSGLFDRALIGGEIYTVSLRNNANIHAGGSLSASGFMGGTFNYTIKDAVPEPASWALMLGGFGMVGGAMRARWRASANFA